MPSSPEAPLLPRTPAPPPVRTLDPEDTHGEIHVDWAYDTPVSAPARGLAPDLHEGTMSPIAAPRRVAPEAVADAIPRAVALPDRFPTPQTTQLPPSPWHGLALAVLLGGLGALALAGLASIATLVALLIA